VVNPEIHIPTAPTMAVIYCLSSAKTAGKNMTGVAALNVKKPFIFRLKDKSKSVKAWIKAAIFLIKVKCG
jgi:hypothetical protein